MTTQPKFDIDVELSEVDGNAFFVMGAVTKALRRNGATAEQIEEFRNEAMNGDYDHLLQTCMKWVNVS
jgi:hypothetical protein